MSGFIPLCHEVVLDYAEACEVSRTQIVGNGGRAMRGGRKLSDDSSRSTEKAANVEAVRLVIESDAVFLELEISLQPASVPSG